jgi:RHS repeat-associated protein
LKDMEWLDGVLQYINHADGRIIKNGSTYAYEYSIKDHVGNVRTTFADEDGNGILTPTEVKSRNDYYAFGLLIDGGYRIQESNVSSRNKNLFNDREFVFDMHMDLHSLGVRMMDPAVGRFISPDILSDFAPEITPYRYGFNNPISYSDPDGLFETEEAARRYADDNGIAIGNSRWQFWKHHISRQDDGTFAITKYGNTEYYFGSPSTDPEVNQTAAEKSLPALDATSGGAVSRADHALDIYQQEGIQSYIYQSIGNAHYETARDFAGQYGGRSVAVRNLPRLGGRLGNGAAKGVTLPKIGIKYFDDIADLSNVTKNQLVSYSKQLESLYKSGKIGALTRNRAALLVKQARKLGVEVRIDKGHPGTFWNMDHLNIGPSGYHVPILPK